MVLYFQKVGFEIAQVLDLNHCLSFPRTLRVDCWRPDLAFSRECAVEETLFEAEFPVGVQVEFLAWSTR